MLCEDRGRNESDDMPEHAHDHQLSPGAGTESSWPGSSFKSSEGDRPADSRTSYIQTTEEEACGNLLFQPPCVWY